MQPEFYVYVYRNPAKDMVPFYVGKGHGNRAWSHLSGGNGRNPYFKNALAKLQRSGIAPVIDILPSASEASAFEEEKRLIRLYGRKCDGGTLTNITTGGDGVSGYVHSDQMKQHFSEIQSRKKHSEETKRKISESKQRCAPVSVDTRNKLRSAHLGRVLSTEHRAKLSEAKKGKPRVFSEQHKENLRQASIRHYRNVGNTAT